VLKSNIFSQKLEVNKKIYHKQYEWFENHPVSSLYNGGNKVRILLLHFRPISFHQNTKCSKWYRRVLGSEKIVCHLSTIRSRTTLHQTWPPSGWQVSNIISVIHCLLSIFKNSQGSEMIPIGFTHPETSPNSLLF
jgi:hypothetical protein